MSASRPVNKLQRNQAIKAKKDEHPRSRHLACLFIADGNVDASASVIQYNLTL
jgi:hypothetical protein